MAVRIPGPQRPLGLDRYFLPGAYHGNPGPSDRAERILGEAGQVYAAWADRDMTPAGVQMHQTQEVDRGLSDAQAQGDHRQSAAAGTAARVVELGRDTIGPSLGPIDDSVDQVGGAVSHAGPGQGPNLGPPPDDWTGHPSHREV